MSKERIDSILYARIKNAIKGTEDTISRLSDRFDQSQHETERAYISEEMRSLYNVHAVLENLLEGIY